MIDSSVDWTVYGGERAGWDNQKYQCEDAACPNNLCYPDAVTGKHIHLMHQHLHFWSSGVVCVCVLYSASIWSWSSLDHSKPRLKVSRLNAHPTQKCSMQTVKAPTMQIPYRATAMLLALKTQMPPASCSTLLVSLKCLALTKELNRIKMLFKPALFLSLYLPLIDLQIQPALQTLPGNIGSLWNCTTSSERLMSLVPTSCISSPIQISRKLAWTLHNSPKWEILMTGGWKESVPGLRLKILMLRHFLLFLL